MKQEVNVFEEAERLGLEKFQFSMGDINETLKVTLDHIQKELSKDIKCLNCLQCKEKDAKIKRLKKLISKELLKE